MTENKTESKQEQGRSMTEMLGVLAVIGVLSVGGVAGYTYAMNKHRANEITENISRMAFLASSQLMIGNDISLQEFDTDGKGVKIMGTYPVEGIAYDDDTFGLRVSGVSDSVCEKIDKQEWPILVDLLINDDDVCQGDDNTMEFIFSNNMGKHEGCLGGYTGENCEEKIACENGGTWTPGGCECAEGWYGPKCDSDCDGFKDKSGTCYSCSEPATKNVTGVEEECSRCPNKEVKVGTNGISYCTDKECQQGYYKIETVGITACTSCDISSSPTTTPEECDKCGNVREYVYDACRLACGENEARNNNLYCKTCPIPSGNHIETYNENELHK